jgi:hypothetical protein
MPTIVGSSHGAENELDSDSIASSQMPKSTAHRTEAAEIVTTRPVPLKSSPVVSKKFVSPASFYEQNTPKSKAKGPLYVHSSALIH